MKESIAKKWVEELKSGKYEQGTGQLKDENCFCCLGVLTQMYLEENSLSGLGEVDCSIEERNEFPPEDVAEWADMKSERASLIDIDYKKQPDNVYRCAKNLADLNDNNYSFDEIADIINEHWKEL